MTPEEQITYLANIRYIMCCDGAISSHETDAFETICKNLKILKKSQNQAEKKASSEGFILSPVGCFSERIRNLEDMITVSLADGNIDISERSAIVDFARSVGITQDQINLIVKESKAKIAMDDEQMQCIKCSAMVASNSNFCPECGTPCRQAKPSIEQIEFNYPTTGITLEFAESTSASFDSALTQAKKAPDYQQCVRNKKNWYLATWPREQIEEATILAEHLKTLKNKKVFLNGKSLEWNDVFGFVSCFRECKKAFNRQEFCFGIDDNRLNLWGCRGLHMNWDNWSEWLSFGYFKKKNVFVFDKARIKHELNINYQDLQFCPLLRPQLIQAIVDHFPEQVKVDYKYWKYKESYNVCPNSMEVTVTTREDGYSVTNTFHTNGVSPIGFSVAKDILSRAIKQAGIADVNIKQLLGN